MPGSRSIVRGPSSYGALLLNDLDAFASAAVVDTNSGHAIGLVVVNLPVTAATTILVGDAVFIAATGLLNKSTTVTDYAARVGIVCGGHNTDFRVVDDYSQVGVTLAKSSTTAIQNVLVAIAGVYWALADETLAVAGALVGIAAASSTAGRLKSTSPVAGRILGVKLSVAQETAGVAFPLLITHA